MPLGVSTLLTEFGSLGGFNGHVVVSIQSSIILVGLSKGGLVTEMALLLSFVHMASGLLKVSLGGLVALVTLVALDVLVVVAIGGANTFYGFVQSTMVGTVAMENSQENLTQAN